MTNPFHPLPMRRIPHPYPLVMRCLREKLMVRMETRWQWGVILLKKKMPLGMGMRENLWKKGIHRKTPMRGTKNPLRRRI